MIGMFIVWLVSFLILFLGIKFGVKIIGGEDIAWWQAFVIALIIYFVGQGWGMLAGGALASL